MDVSKSRGLITERMLGVMKLYLHGYPLQIWSVLESRLGSQEVWKVPASGWLMPGVSGTQLSTSHQGRQSPEYGITAWFVI